MAFSSGGCTRSAGKAAADGSVPPRREEDPSAFAASIMRGSTRALIAIDALVNFGLGLAFLALPTRFFQDLGLPVPGTRLYTAILGAVLIGIAIALILWLRSHQGLGPSGAIAINLLGSLAALVWLATRSGQTTGRGTFLVASAAGLVLLLAVLELTAGVRKPR